MQRRVIRGKRVRTTTSDKAAPCLLDRVNRQFHAPAPNKLWVSGFTDLAAWARFAYVGLRDRSLRPYIVGWLCSRIAHASFVLDTVEQAMHDRRPVHRGGLVHQSDRGSQYVSARYIERLAEPALSRRWAASGSATTMPWQREHQRPPRGRSDPPEWPWWTIEAVEFATLEWSTCSITADCSNPSTICRQPKLRQTTPH